MINTLRWKNIATYLSDELAHPTIQPQMYRLPFDYSGGYLFIVHISAVPDADNDITRGLALHFHTDAAIQKAGEISVCWQDEEGFDTSNAKHRLKKGPNNRLFSKLAELDFKDDADTAAVVGYVANRIRRGDYVTKLKSTGI